MKVLTIWNPWARLIAAGLKRVENRSFATDYRGPLLVHVGQHWKQDEVQEQLEGLRDDGLLDDTNTPALGELRAERGKVIAKTSIVGCRKVEEGDADPWAVPGAYAWELGPVELVEPFDLVGRQGLFELPAGIEVVALGQRLAVVEKPAPAPAPATVLPESPKALRRRLVAEAVPAEEGHGFVGQVHDRDTGEVRFTSGPLATRQDAEEAAHGFVDDVIDEAVRQKLARLELLETGHKYIARLRVRLAEIERIRKDLGDEKKRLRASVEERLYEMQNGRQEHFDFEGNEEGEVAEAGDDEAGETEGDEAGETPTVREAQADEAFERMLTMATLEQEQDAQKVLEARATAIVQMSVSGLQDELCDETSVDLIRAIMDAEGRKKKSLRRKSVMAFLQRKLEQLFEAEEGGEAA